MKWICVEIFLNRPSAEGARLALEAEDIPTQIIADDAGGVRPELNMQKGVQLLVPEGDLGKAKEIFSELEKEHMLRSASESAESEPQGFLIRLRRWFQG